MDTLFEVGVALAAGFVGSMVGGTGIILLPTFLALGLSPQVALGTNKMLSVCMTLPATIILFRKNTLKVSDWITPIIACCIGSFIGVYLVNITAYGYLKKIVPILVILISGYSLWHKTAMGCAIDIKLPKYFHLLICLLISLMSGYIGVGAGLFWISASKLLYKLEIMQALSIARLFSFISNITSLLIFLYYGYIDYYLGIVMGIAVVGGAVIGTYTVSTLKHAWLEKAVILLAILLSSLTLIIN